MRRRWLLAVLMVFGTAAVFAQEQAVKPEWKE